MREEKRRRPQVESLETMTLLSGAAGAAAHALIPNPVALTGSIAAKIGGHSGLAVVSGSGTLRPLGHVTFSISGRDKSDTISSASGKLFLAITASDGQDNHYDITGGTKALAGETGSGIVRFALVARGKLAITFS